MTRTRMERAFHFTLGAWRLPAGILAAMVAVTLASCDNLTAGGWSEAEVIVAGNEYAAPATTSSLVSGGVGVAQMEGLEEGSWPLAAQVLNGANSVQGTVTVELRAYLLTPGGFPAQPILRAVREVSVGVSGQTSLGAATIPSGVYSGIRVVFSEVTAEVQGGEGHGDSPVEVVVDFEGAAELEVLRENVNILVTERSRLELMVDLRAPIWLAPVIGESGPVVSPEQFLNAVRINWRHL